ncbi:Mitochondrial import inner membrane translocase subunit tim23 [Lobosporangium transversale]|uniref:Tim17/Tim22/Tim23/Pmp24 family-domain-containing protein n=1 Tax=Lobosporangium transversale TaxID=64571 RepID=A0A1Y2GG84_9FUNG|nr:Tim17/Tim22/Tim23/Pmp24 family-domain-containing protein [Lobosporangium transversale]KAF9916923.1 Mitochondrial import inner membrane translocase subunit tim23 [Lobosporangium transversale]ORZ08859.1 Tim17/Tim22/Tim23/Pmp24 family-domain-containing protein [Lobosporangium transversale]|eukprot:XP_021878642.1 Tim17/Tim22/Tim23/Pmp24 family-domain-containing protein [Lobosporangium transversale]
MSSHHTTNIEEEDSFAPIYASQEDFNPNDTVSAFLNTAYDPARLHPLAGLGGGLDYLNLDGDEVLPTSQGGLLPSRGWSDDLTYGTGLTYITGLSLGGAFGFYEGLRSSPSPAFKIRLNTVLNSMTRRGPFIGNSAGVLALMYNGINGVIGKTRGTHDPLNSIAAGALTGAIFKSTAGLRAAGSAGGVCAVLAGIWAFGKEAVL